MPVKPTYHDTKPEPVHFEDKAAKGWSSIR